MQGKGQTLALKAGIHNCQVLERYGPGGAASLTIVLFSSAGSTADEGDSEATEMRRPDASLDAMVKVVL